ncbi:Origin recognition complex subunit 3 [Saitoella coloradoensis]
MPPGRETIRHYDENSETYQEGRPPKRRRLGQAYTFKPLLNGKENKEAVRLRQTLYEWTWGEQKRKIEHILSSVNERMLTELGDFVRHAYTEEPAGIPVGLVLAGPNISSHSRLFNQITSATRALNCGPVVLLTSREVPNLRACLKKIIEGAMDAVMGETEEDELAPSRSAGEKKGIKLANYDLKILAAWMKHKLEAMGASAASFKITIAIQDTETLAGNLLPQLLNLLHNYLPQIPVVVLLGIATSLQHFQEMLPSATTRLLQAQKFDVRRGEDCLEVIVREVLLAPSNKVRLGARLYEFLWDKWRMHTQSIESFIDGMQFAYMCHFYANPLSVLVAASDTVRDRQTWDTEGNQEGWGALESGWKVAQPVLQKEHFQAIRTLPSFRHFVSKQLEMPDCKAGRIRAVLENDMTLGFLIPEFAAENVKHAAQLEMALNVLDALQSSLISAAVKKGRLEVYLMALQGGIVDGRWLKEMLMLMKKMNSGSLKQFLAKCVEGTAGSDVNAKFAGLLDELVQIVEAEAVEIAVAEESSGEEGNKNRGLVSEYKLQEDKEGDRATHVSKKIRIASSKASMGNGEVAYTIVVEKVHALLKEYLEASLKSYTELTLHEVFYYNVTKPHQDAFSAQHRAAIQTALIQPHHYLACSCCAPRQYTPRRDEEIFDDDADGGLTTQPDTAILHQLYLECGSLINVYDWFTAFGSIVERRHKQDEDDGDEGRGVSEDGQARSRQKEDEEEDRKQGDQARFLRGMAEMQFMGFIKPTKRKTDHVSRLVWGSG